MNIKYLDKIVVYLVDDTEINYEKEEIKFPSLPYFLLYSPSLPFFFYVVFDCFSTYVKDTYGLTEDEVKYVWDEYKKIIFDKINYKPLNESTITKKDYLDKIIEYLVEDTVIDYGREEIQFPFPSSSYSYPFFFWTLLPRPNSFADCFSKYVKDMYGLTDQEIDYIWERYKTIISNKKNNGRLFNESVDNRKDYLDKILEYLVEDTFIDYKINKISFPFSTVGPLNFPRHPLAVTAPVPPNFSTYCKDTYGLTDQEIDYIWAEYKKIIFDKINYKPLNESVDNKKEIYLDKIVQFMVDDTFIDYEKEEIKYPFLTGRASARTFHFSNFYVVLFYTYVKDMYGLTYREIDYVWDEYIPIIKEKINNGR